MINICEKCKMKKIECYCIINKKISKKQKLVNDIFKPGINGKSEWITREELSTTPLKLSNNGNSRHGIFFNDIRYIWEKKTEKNTTVALRTTGFNYDEINALQRPIREDIRQKILLDGCIVCGSRSMLCVDHKNDLYNDPRVLNKKTQVLSDFQCLCNHCNLLKRQVSKDTKKTGKRYKATNIKTNSIFGIDFINGDETYDPSDINAMVGTYWYDPIAFMKHISTTLNLLPHH